MRDQTVTTPVSPVDPHPSQDITYRTMRSVHGPVFAFATVNGRPVALTKAKAVDFHELDAVIPFMKLAENKATDPASFKRIMGKFPGTENWFYADRKNVAFIQSGRYPRHTAGSDVDLPFWGDGRADWQHFNPSKYTFRSIPASHRPTATNPKDGFLISWNNKEALGWRKGPTEWSNGPVHRALILKDKLLQQVHKGGGHVDLTGLTRAVNLAATTDLRGQDILPWMLQVIAHHDGSESQALDIMRAWRRSGSNRLDANGDNVYDHSAAVALMDAWWPRAVRAQFEPALGKTCLDRVEGNVRALGGARHGIGAPPSRRTFVTFSARPRRAASLSSTAAARRRSRPAAPSAAPSEQAAVQRPDRPCTTRSRPSPRRRAQATRPRGRSTRCATPDATRSRRTRPARSTRRPSPGRTAAPSTRSTRSPGTGRARRHARRVRCAGARG